MGSAQWRTDRCDSLPVYRGLASCFSEFLVSWRCGAYPQGDTVREIGGNLCTGGKRDIEEEKRVRALGKRSCGIARWAMRYL